MALIIRPAGPGDEPAVVALVQELAVALDYPTTVDEHYVRHFLASPVSDILLAFDGGAPVGLLSYAMVPGLFHAADSGLIESLVITEGRRGEGIGRQLLQTAVRLLEDAGLRGDLGGHRGRRRGRPEAVLRRRAHGSVGVAREARRALTGRSLERSLRVRLCPRRPLSLRRARTSPRGT